MAILRAASNRRQKEFPNSGTMMRLFKRGILVSLILAIVPPVPLFFERFSCPNISPNMTGAAFSPA